MPEYCFKATVDLREVTVEGVYAQFARVSGIPPGIPNYLKHDGQFFIDGEPAGGSSLTYKPIHAEEMQGGMDFGWGSVTSGYYTQLGSTRYSYKVEFESRLAASSPGIAEIFCSIDSVQDAELLNAGFGPVRCKVEKGAGGFYFTPWLSLQGYESPTTVRPGAPIIASLYVSLAEPPYEAFWQNLVSTREVP